MTTQNLVEGGDTGRCEQAIYAFLAEKERLGISRCRLFQAYSFGHGIVDGQTDQVAYQGGCASIPRKETTTGGGHDHRVHGGPSSR